MTETDFWIMVEASHDTALNDMELKCRLIQDAVTKLPEADAADCVRWLDAALARTYTWPLWGAAYVMKGGCGDDAFRDFRACLISRGEAAVVQALGDPDSLAEKAGDIESWFYEGYDNAILNGARLSLGALPARAASPMEPSGEKWAEDEVDARYPRLHELYG